MKKMILLLTILLVGCTPKQRGNEKEKLIVKETPKSKIEYAFNDLEIADIECGFVIDYEKYDLKKSYVTLYQDGNAKNLSIYDEVRDDVQNEEKGTLCAEQYLYYGFKQIDEKKISIIDRMYGNDGLSSSQRKESGVTTSPKDIGYNLKDANLYVNEKVESLKSNEIILAAIYFSDSDNVDKVDIDDQKIKQMIQNGETVITVKVTIERIPENIKSQRECL